MSKRSRSYIRVFSALLCVSVSLWCAVSSASDWPQWRGPARNGISSERGWATRWPASGPRRVWSVQVGEGFSSVAVVGGKVYTAGNAGGQDTIYCLNAANGRPLWRYSYPCGSGDYGGPRATPAISQGRLYMMSREGKAVCLDAITGKRVWEADVARASGAPQPQWGFAGSPLVLGNLVIYNIGRAGSAVDKNTGKFVWRSGGGPAGYASPVAFPGGVAIFAGSALVAVNPANGRVLWSLPWRTSYDVNAADPIIAGDAAFISSNYGTGAALCRFAGNRPSIVWQNRNMKNHFNTSVLVNGFVYGNDENTLKCIDIRNGAERWNLRGIGKGGLIAADGKLIVLGERGELIIANASPDRYTEIARARVLDGTCWTHPVLANGSIYCRSHEGTLVRLDVSR